MRRRGWPVALLVVLALAWAGAAEAAEGAKTGEHRLRLIRSWSENPIVEGRAVPGRVEIWFDYTDGVVITRVIASARPGGTDTLVKSQTYPKGVGTPRPSPEEIDEAMELVRSDKEMARVIAATHAVLDGGFQIYEPAGEPCGPGTRCLKVQLMTQDRLGLVRNVVVDLARQAIVYRSFVPEGGKGK